MDSLENAVAQHYGADDLLARIDAGLKSSGVDPARLTLEDLAPVDEFHIGGRKATQHAVSRMSLSASDHLLDVGCGLGGAVRYISAAIGCRATGIDLTPEFIDVARNLTARLGLSAPPEFETASALAMPFEDQTFDAAITFHVAMNIPDRAGLYTEIARVLRPGATFCIYDVIKLGPAISPIRRPGPSRRKPAMSPARRRRENICAKRASRLSKPRTAGISPCNFSVSALPVARVMARRLSAPIC
ncbi:MAG: class I SAM-dependent methyltransferase [Proteobacteria bacterium]|nr:class I SAM-dependent methyltransferase [Pseudomonadota bacterium]